MDVVVIGFRTTDGKVQPLAWSPMHISAKHLRCAVRKFRKDSDFLEPYQANYTRLYDSKADAKKSLPRY